jgi:hypothetical protein
MKKTGSTTHARFTVSDIPRGGLLRPALAFHGLRARREERGALGLEDAPAGNRQCVILSAASEEGRGRKHDRYSPASFTRGAALP